MITVSELGDIHGFEHPRQLMTYLGLVPTESSSGPHQRLGCISRCGNSHQRWLLTECAEHYAIPPKISKELARRQEGQSEAIKALSWKAQNRLHNRFIRLLASPPSTQQSQGRCGPGTLWFRLGRAAHPGLLQVHLNQHPRLNLGLIPD
jgi:hypothetical protein